MSLKDAPVQEESVGDAPVQAESVGHNPMVTVVDPAPIVANLDAPADDDPDDNYDDDDDDDDTENDTGIMPKYIKAIQNRIRHENSSVGVEGWLMEYLRKHDWWIRAIDRRHLCHKLKLEFNVQDDEDAYFRDIYVWLPEEARCKKTSY